MTHHALRPHISSEHTPLVPGYTPMSIFSRGALAASPRDPQALRGARRRAKELGILEEFWEFVSEGNRAAAMDRLALQEVLEEERARHRRTRDRLSILFIAVCLALSRWVMLRGV